MWASRRPSAPAPPEACARTYVGVPSSLSSSSSSIDAFPQLRLMSTISQRVFRLLAKYPAQYICASAAAALALTITGTLLARCLVHRWRDRVRGGRQGAAVPALSHGVNTKNGRSVGASGAVGWAKAASGRRGAEDGNDGVDFADPAESAFLAYVRRSRRQKEAPLMAALSDLETAAAQLAELRRRHRHRDSVAEAERGDGYDRDLGGTREGSIDSGVDHGGAFDDGAVSEAQAKVYRLAVVADELLTQWICSLDGVPVRQSEALKQRRKAMVQEAATLTRRISPHLPHIEE
ncbi:hypothetical protein JIQ42_05309 [Leishmania sp. Namibia]|uniref:hypothetical protein n=1 Tax=Leishmania sp. Namibia TaxID=2802991 RepID=UPI001B56C90D|nr:hypothetical protein JIQ42_05309 [Leishmania sp. Namibia]